MVNGLPTAQTKYWLLYHAMKGSSVVPENWFINFSHDKISSETRHRHKCCIGVGKALMTNVGRGSDTDSDYRQ